MSNATRRIDGIPLLSVVEPGSDESTFAPGLNAGGDLQMRPGETVLRAIPFPELRRATSNGDTRPVLLPGEGGTTTVTSQRVVFIREKYDVGAFGKNGSRVVLRAMSRTTARMRRGGQVAAGQIPFATVILVADHVEKPLIGRGHPRVAVAAVVDGDIWQVELRGKIDGLGARVAAAVAAARGIAVPTPKGSGTEQRWEFPPPSG
jgi:hypothetical protein